MNHSNKTIERSAKVFADIISDKTWQGMHWIRDNKRAAIYKRDNHRCVYCQMTFVKAKRNGIRISLDHVAPRELGGTNEVTNLVTACQVCNSAKSDKGIREFLRYLRGLGFETKGIADRIRRQRFKPVVIVSPTGRLTKLTPLKNEIVRSCLTN